MRNRYLAIGVGAVIGYCAISELLQLVGKFVPPLRHDPQVWGTYGDWAAATIPLLAVLASIDTWSKDRVRAAEIYAASLVVGVSLEDRFGVVWMKNDGPRPIMVRGRTVAVGSEIPNVSVGDAIQTADGSNWTVKQGLTLERVVL